MTRGGRRTIRALETLAIIGAIAALTLKVTDQPDALWALLAFLGYLPIAVIVTAALEGGDAVTEPQLCLTPDPFGDQDDATPFATPFATRIHPDHNTGA